MMHDDLSALVHAYLSGELSGDDERALFRRLSEREDARAELAAQLRMQEAAARDISTVNIPPEATARVFQRLGYDVPASLTAQPSGGALSIARLWKAIRIPLAVTASSAAAIASVYYVATRDFSAPDPSRANRSAATTEARPSASIPNSPTTSIEPTARDQQPTNPNVGTSPTNTEVNSLASRPKHQDKAASTSTESEGSPFSMPNEPYFYLDIGKFASVDYLTQQKIIGVSDNGKIFYSTDAGKSWVLQQSPTTADLFGVNFIDSLTGVVVGANGTVLRTASAGVELSGSADHATQGWRMISSGTRSDLITVRCVSRQVSPGADTLFACGAGGTIARSVDAGRTWNVQQSPVTVRLFQIEFTNSTHGLIRGERGITVRTTNAGETWTNP